MNKFEIYTPSPGSFLVVCNGRVVENWRELQDAARIAALPELTARWQAHWQDVLTKVGQSICSTDPETLMWYVYTPNAYYPCPPELAAQAVVLTHQRV